MIIYKSEKEVAEMRQGGRILACVLRKLIDAAKSGVTTGELDTMAEQLIRQAGCVPVFKGYRQRRGDQPFPDTICTSLNDEVVHGIASRGIRLNSGDIVGIDIGLQYPGKLRRYVLDMAKTIAIGKISQEAKRLLKVTERALTRGIAEMKPENFVHDISNAIQKTFIKEDLGIIRDLVGHGVGYQLHEEPCVYNFIPENGPLERVKLEAGMVLAIEPMATLGGYRVKVAADGWTIKTVDGSLAAQFEHTVAVTKNGHEILTLE